MPPLAPAPQVVEVKVNGLINSIPWANIFHLQYTGTAPQVADLNALCTSVLSAYATNFMPLVNAGAALSNAVASDLTNSAAAQGTATNTTVGSRTGTALSNAQACVISWKINNRYRGGHPRSYLPATVASDIINGKNFQDAYVTAVNTAATAFRTALNAISISGASYKMVCLRRTINKVTQNPAVPITIQTNLVDHRIDSQRDRMGKDLPA
jgi:hypothetical protein